MGDFLTPSPKAPGSFDRVTRIEDVLPSLPDLQSRFGITRVSELTHLDRVGIPVFSAVVPKSRDALGVYNGKGLDVAQARVGAVMEAVERQVAADYECDTCEISASEIAQALDLEALQLFPAMHDAPLACARGFDLVRNREIPVPMALVRTPWDGVPAFPSTHTSGLASGSTRAEAVYHAICELVERHVWSLAESFARVARNSALIGGADISIARELKMPTGIDVVDRLYERIRLAGLAFRLLVLADGHLPIVAHATILEPGADAIQFAFGVGCSLSPIHAILRAITEAAQSRLTDIQGAREDIARSGELPQGRWYVDAPAQPIGLDELCDRASSDILEDIQHTVNVLVEIGVRTIGVVDLTPPDMACAIVRVVVPELSSVLVDGRVGPIVRERLANARTQLSLHR